MENQIGDYRPEENNNVESEVIQKTSKVNERVKELTEKSLEQLRESAFINHVLAVTVEILGETHLTKSEKITLINSFNEARTIEDVNMRADVIKETFNIKDKKQNFKEEFQEDDSFWSKGFVQELDNYYNIYKGVDVKKTLNSSVVEIDHYFKLLTSYASNQDNPDKLSELTDKILQQEPITRDAVDKLKKLSFTLDQESE